MKAVAVLDLAGFTRSLETWERDAVISAIEELHTQAEEAALAHAGRIVGGAADTVIALLPDVPAALAYCCRVITALGGRVSAGVGWGELELTHVGWMGLELNRASRLGEDVAGPGELRLTKAAQSALNTARPE